MSIHLPRFARAVNHLNLITYDGSGQTVHPDILFFPNGLFGYRYWMVNTPFPNNSDIYENPSIWFSNDGFSWSSLNNNPIVPQPPDGFLSDPCIVWDESRNKLRVYYRRSYPPPISTDSEIRMIESGNGFDWSNDQVVFTHQSEGRYSPQVYCDGDGNYKLWIVAQELYGGDQGSLKYRSSSDGIIWTNEADVTFTGLPTDYRPWHINIKRLNNKFEWEGVCIAYKIGGGHALFYIYGDNPLVLSAQTDEILKTTPDSWDYSGFYQSVLLRKDNEYRLWYTGRANSGQGAENWLAYTSEPKNTLTLKGTITKN